MFSETKLRFYFVFQSILSFLLDGKPFIFLRVNAESGYRLL